jgi:hypothetical protein
MQAFTGQQQQQQVEYKHGAQRSLQYMIVNDEHQEVQTRPNALPYSAVCYVTYQKGSCTGVIVGPGAVLTAAHCVYNRLLNGWQKAMLFVPHRHRQGDRVVAIWAPPCCVCDYLPMMVRGDLLVKAAGCILQWHFSTHLLLVACPTESSPVHHESY